MKKAIHILLVVISVSVLLQGCNRKVALSDGMARTNVAYDSTAFDYVFVEALKQKFLGNAGDALKYLEQCVKINPESDAAYFEMAQIASMLSDNKNGKKYALKAVSLDEKNMWYLVLAANIYYQENNLDSAALFYEKAIASSPEKENLKLNLAGIYSENGKYDKAAAIYRYFEKEYGVNENTTVVLVKNLMNSGNWEEAKGKIQELLAKYPDEILYNGLLAEIYHKTGERENAVKIYEKLLEKDPGNPQTLMSVTEFLISEKQYDDLFPVLSKVVLNDSIPREQKISLFVRMVSDTGIIRKESENLELTLYVLEAANKGDNIMMLLRPELYQNAGRLQDAVDRLEAIIAESPENYYAWERLLFLYSEIRDWDKLYSKGYECATKFNMSFVAKALYANAALEKGELGVAEGELKKAKILAGNDTNLIVQVLVMEADLYYRKKEFSKSFETFGEALKVKPGDHMVLNNYAYLLAEQGVNLREAEKMAKEVIDEEKGNSTYLDTYAWVLYKRGRYKEAQKILEAIIDKDEKPSAEWYEHLGYIMKATGKCTEATGYWKMALKLDTRKDSLLKEIEKCGSR